MQPTAWQNDGTWDYIEKDPDAVLDYPINLTDWLDGDTLDSATFTVPTGLTKDSETNTTTVATLWLSGGTPGRQYFVNLEWTTAGGRTDQRTFRFDVRDR